MTEDRRDALRAVRRYCGKETCEVLAPLRQRDTQARKLVDLATATTHHIRQTLADLLVIHRGGECSCDHAPHQEHHPLCPLGKILRELDDTSSSQPDSQDSAEIDDLMYLVEEFGL